jgi:hypothetical protein
MSKPKLFIGSSQKNLRVANVLAEGLEEYAEARVWSEGVFGLNEGFLETLLKKLGEYDFAVFVLASDDLTMSKEESRPSPRDNVLFESGLFMGVLGRDRVFLVYDEAVGLKIPSDLAGVSLASYDGARIGGSDAAAAVRKACRLIGDSITASRFPHLVGPWRSRYPMAAEEGYPLLEEDVEIRPCRGGISIISTNNPKNDGCRAYGRMLLEGQFVGEWQAFEEHSDQDGLFLITVSPSGNYMHGYFTSPNETGGVSYASWVLAKKEGADAAKIEERLKKAEALLARVTLPLSKPGAGA